MARQSFNKSEPDLEMQDASEMKKALDAVGDYARTQKQLIEIQQVLNFVVVELKRLKDKVDGKSNSVSQSGDVQSPGGEEGVVQGQVVDPAQRSLFDSGVVD